MACTAAIENDIATQASYDAWKDSINTRLTEIGNATTPTPAMFNEITTTIPESIAAHTNCILSQDTNAGALTNEIAELSAASDTLDSTIEERKNDVSISHDRAVISRNPAITRSYYDGWFPLGRPLKHYTVPLLIGLGLFFLSLSFFYGLNLFGLQTQIAVNIPSIRPPGTTGSYGATSLFKATPFRVMAALSIILLGTTIYGFSKK